MAKPRLDRKSALRGFQAGLLLSPTAEHELSLPFLDQLDALLQSRPSPDALCTTSLAERLYVSLVPGDYRKRRGQFFTPPLVARFMVEWILQSRPHTILDPAVGLGVFLTQILTLHPPSPTRLFAVDIDPTMLEGSRRILAHCGAPTVHMSCEDFILADTNVRHDAIVGNPPYVRHHDLDYSSDVFDVVGSRCGVRLSRLTNIYALFLLRCYQSLSPSGRYALITPSEFLNADFGVSVKEFLVRSGSLHGLVLFDHASSVFGGAITTACITLVDRARDPRAPVHLAKVTDINQLPDVLEYLGGDLPEHSHHNGWTHKTLPLEVLDPRSKWNPIFDLKRPPRNKHLVPLGDYASTMRGIATGANSFFTLSAQEAREAGLSASELKPCITKARAVRFLDFTMADLDVLRRDDRKCFIIDLHEPLSHEASAYVRRGEEEDLHRRYLTAARSPWYAIEQRRPGPILVTVFGRDGFRFVHNHARVLNLTAFHCIYPQLEDEDAIRALMAYLTSRYCRRLLDEQKRVYGDGLDKLEPRDLLSLPVLDVRRVSVPTLRSMVLAFESVCREARTNTAWQDSTAANLLEEVVGSALGS